MSHAKIEKPCENCGEPYVGLPVSRYGPCCRWRFRGRKAKKYVWTPEKDEYLRRAWEARPKKSGKHGRFRDAVALASGWGWPGWVFHKRAAQLGLTEPRERRDWTEEEERFLLLNAGSRHLHWLAKKLKRSEASVALKLKREKISRRWREGYTMRDLELCFGEDHKKISKWIADGKFEARRRGTRRRGPGGQGNGPADPLNVTDAMLLEFVLNHPMEINLRKVDQRWFMDLITGGAVVRAELAKLKREEVQAA